MKEEGPEHEKMFYVGVYVEDRLLGHGSGRCKKDAEQAAAKEALEHVVL